MWNVIAWKYFLSMLCVVELSSMSFQSLTLCNRLAINLMAGMLLVYVLVVVLLEMFLDFILYLGGLF